MHHWRKFGENSTNTFQDIALTSPESDVFSILYSTVTSTFDLLTPNCEVFISVADEHLVKMCQILCKLSC